MSTILLTGFEPFGGESVNPSWQVAQALDGESIGDARVVGLRLPCVFGATPGCRRRCRTVPAASFATMSSTV